MWSLLNIFFKKEIILEIVQLPYPSLLCTEWKKLYTDIETSFKYLFDFVHLIQCWSCNFECSKMIKRKYIFILRDFWGILARKATALDGIIGKSNGQKSYWKWIFSETRTYPTKRSYCENIMKFIRENKHFNF